MELGKSSAKSAEQAASQNFIHIDKQRQTELQEMKRVFAAKDRKITNLKKDVTELRKTNAKRKKQIEAANRDSRLMHQLKRLLQDIRRWKGSSRRKKTKEQTKAGSKRLCYLCRCKGHLATDCPKKQPPNASEDAEASQHCGIHQVDFGKFKCGHSSFTPGCRECKSMWEYLRQFDSSDSDPG